MAINFDIEPRFISGTTGLRLQVNPDDFVDGTSWELLEAGGTGQINVSLARLYDVALGVAGGDLVEIWARNTDGAETLRARGVVTIPEPTLDLKEKCVLTAYGRMEDMNHVVLDKVIVHPADKDLSAFAAEIADDYAARRPGLVFVRDIQDTGVSLETLTLSNTTARAAMDQLQQQAGRNSVWGWDIDPVTNLDRFYLRPRVASVGHQWFVGDRVKVLSSPLDHTNIANGIKLQGGPAKYPQLVTNPSFEIPIVPNEASGNMLSDGGFEGNITWNYINGASRNNYDPSSGHNASAHSGQWYAILDNANEEIWQEVPVTPGVQYTASLFARRENGSLANVGSLIIEGRSSSGTVLETPQPLPIAPSSTAWSGGQGSTIFAGDALTTSVTFTNTSTTKARIRIKTTNGTGGKGLLIDDVVFAQAGALGQTGWMADDRSGSTFTSEFRSIDWACRGGSFDGIYGVRVDVAPTTAYDPVLEPIGGLDGGSNGNHFKPTPSQTLRCSAQVRMAPGLNSSAGNVRLEYTEWSGPGSETQKVRPSGTSIPNDGAWHYISMDVTAHGDAASATIGLSFGSAGVYDIDCISVRDSAAGDEFLRGANFEKYVVAEDTSLTGVSAAAALSFTTYGRRESVVSNPDIVTWNGDAKAWAGAYFTRNAVPLRRDRVELIHEHTQAPSPGEGTQVRVSGTAAADITDWPARAQYTWSKATLAVSLELSNERPTVAKLLRSRSGSSSGTGSGGASSIAAVGSGTGGGVTTPVPTPVASSTVSGTVKTTVDHVDPTVYEKTEMDAIIAALPSGGSGGGVGGTLYLYDHFS
ncbi:hypothetical protein CCAX7_000320 [Capsulimonas corticalis]|uniref:Uncharacterized protein n=1 Tax=Capsulimonas corticalis TaxID=2219043 RepID=A0A402CRI5_9BACT|nr:hypothetical protein [Capsulimonas corticalis]BDI27981.1 hypothetical protein CCAX7_000320 [Capsulimonas corticalis]